jgi:hypothetical protein
MSFDHYFELVENFRQKEDPFYAEICDHARFHTAPSALHLARLNARLSTLDGLFGAASSQIRSDALWTAWTRKEVAQINHEALAACNRKGKPTVNIWASHCAPLKSGRKKSARTAGGAAAAADGDADDDTPAQRATAAAVGSARDTEFDPVILGRLLRYNPQFCDDGVTPREVAGGGFLPPPVLRLAVGMRVKAGMNQCVTVGLTKGALGTVYGFLYSRGKATPAIDATRMSIAKSGRNPAWGVPTVLVQWDRRYYSGESFVPSVERVTPVEPHTFTVTLDGKKWTRIMVPLHVATASTIHGAQGMGTDSHVASPPDGGPGQLLYVQLSRTTTLSGLRLLRPLTTEDFTRTAKSDDFRAIQAEYARLRSLPKWRPRDASIGEEDDEHDDGEDAVAPMLRPHAAKPRAQQQLHARSSPHGRRKKQRTSMELFDGAAAQAIGTRQPSAHGLGRKKRGELKPPARACCPGHARRSCCCSGG